MNTCEPKNKSHSSGKDFLARWMAKTRLQFIRDGKFFLLLVPVISILKIKVGLRDD
jgi:hypothetical protein